ncbi:MAG: 50S ribosomal protein L33 [Phycisphaerae bacterium]
MAKSKLREYVWMQCSECGELNYRTLVKTGGGEALKKLERMKFCPRDRKHTEHKMKKK